MMRKGSTFMTLVFMAAGLVQLDAAAAAVTSEGQNHHRQLSNKLTAYLPSAANACSDCFTCKQVDPAERKCLFVCKKCPNSVIVGGENTVLIQVNGQEALTLKKNSSYARRRLATSPANLVELVVPASTTTFFDGKDKGERKRGICVTTTTITTNHNCNHNHNYNQNHNLGPIVIAEGVIPPIGSLDVPVSAYVVDAEVKCSLAHVHTPAPPPTPVLTLLPPRVLSRSGAC